jgi:hypothetical protein
MENNTTQKNTNMDLVLKVKKLLDDNKANDICEYPAFRDKYPDFCKRNCEYIYTGTCLSNSTTPTTGKGDTKTTIKITIPKRGNGTCNVTDGQIVSTVSNSCNMPCTYDQWSFIGNNKSLLDSSKWIDSVVSVSSTTKLLSTIHPVIKDLETIVETNSDKIKEIQLNSLNIINNKLLVI